MPDDGIIVKVSGQIPANTWEAVAEAVRADLVKRLALAAKKKWDEVARASLQGSQLSYLKGIQAPEITEGMATIVLAGEVPNRIENGYAAYDMHDTLLSDKVPVVERGSRQKGKHRKKDGSGFYRYIPFRHTGPNTVGAEGAPVGSQYTKEMGAVIGEPLGRVVWRMAKKLNESSDANGFTASLPRNVMPKLKPHHSDSIYAGMYKVRKEYGQVSQNTYRTFRTIASGSPGWRVGAQPGKHFAQDVAQYINGVAQETLDMCVDNMQSGA